MTRHRITDFDALLILLVAVVWLYLLVHSLTRETRLERAYAVDNTGQVVEVYTRGRVWEQNRGERPATDEEDVYDRERGK